MHRLLTVGLILAAARVIAVNDVSLAAQTTSARQVPAIVVSITLQKDKVPLGQSPWAILTVKNLTDELITIHDPYLHLEGPKGELFYRPQAQIITRNLQSRPRLRTVVHVPWNILPGETSTKKYELAWFFDLSNSGQYKIYVEVDDPISQKLLRSNSARFEMQPATH